MAELLYSYKKTDITPEESVLLAGYANRSGTSGEVHRPLTSRCLILKRGKVQICIIVNDLMEVPGEVIHEMRNEISQKTALEFNQIIIVSIHTHSAPLMDYGINAANDRYIKSTSKKISENAIEGILENKFHRAGMIKFGSGFCDIGANRKLIIPETGPAYRVSDPEGIRDKEVKILQICDEKNKNPVTLFNYACHPVTLGFNSLAVSTDYPGNAREMIETNFGGNAIFLNGAAANINPLSENHTDTKIADEFGEKLGNSVINSELIPLTNNIDLINSSGQIEIPFRDQNITRDFIEREVDRKSQQTTEFYHWKSDLRSWGDKIINLLEQGKIQNTFPFENSAIKLGPAIFYFTQGELFVQYQLELKRRFPNNQLFCVGYTHGEGAYIPTAKDYEAIGYETDQAYIYQGLPSPFTKDIEDIYLKESISIINALFD